MKKLIRHFATAAFAALLASGAPAQDFPAKTVRLVVGFPPGGLADILARVLADKLPAVWNQPVVVENRAGASGVLTPARVPRTIVARIHADIRTVMSLPDVRERMGKMGVEIEASSPEDFDKFIRAELLKWSAVAKQAGVKGE